MAKVLELQANTNVCFFLRLFIPWLHTINSSTLCFFGYFSQHFMLGQFSNQNQDNILILFHGHIVLHCLDHCNNFPCVY